MQPAFFSELTDSEREQFEALSAEHRNSLAAIHVANVEAKDETHALEVVRNALANRRDPPGAETARTEETEPIQSAGTMSDEEHAQYLQERDLDREANAADVARRAQGWINEPRDQQQQRVKASTTEERERIREGDVEAGPPQADLDQLRRDLDDADNVPELLEADARLRWAETHNGAICPPERIPTEANLWDSIGKIEEATARAAKLLTALFPCDKGSWQWGKIILSKPTDHEQCLAAVNYLTLEHHPLLDVHSVWCKVGRDRRPAHPLTPLVEHWQAEPKPAAPFRPVSRASLPIFRRESQERRLLDVRQPTIALPSKQMLFDLPELTPPDSVSWLVDLYDRGGGSAMRQGRGAPWHMHLFIGALCNLHKDNRDGEFHRLTFSTDEVVKWLHPDGWNQRGRDWHRLPEALFRLNKELGFVAIPGLGYVQVVGATVIPRTLDDPRVEFIVRIPKTAAEGARIDWPTLCRYRQQSAAMYRAYLAAVDFMHISARHGQPITQEIGQPLRNRAGRPRRRTGGRIVRSDTEREPNPATRYVRGLTEGELVEMVGLKGTDKNHRRSTRKAFQQLDTDGVIDLKQDGQLWRIFGPST